MNKIISLLLLVLLIFCFNSNTEAQSKQYGVYAYKSNPNPPYWPSQYGWHPCYILYVTKEMPNRFDDNPNYVRVRITDNSSAASNFISLFSMHHDDKQDGIVKLASCEAAKEAERYANAAVNQVKKAKIRCPKCANGRWEDRWTPSYDQHFEWAAGEFSKNDFAKAKSATDKEINLRQECLDNCLIVETKVFNNPMVASGFYLDGCLTFAKNCGKPAADYFCNWKGFDEATEWKVRKNSPPTMTIKGREKCEEDFCGRIIMVKCIRKQKIK